jgi:ankyrin repeat protein
MLSVHSRWLSLSLSLILLAGTTGCSSTKAIKAASLGDLATLEQLKAEGKDLHKRDVRMVTPLSKAIGNDQLMAAQFLLDEGADINATSGFAKRSALMVAADADNLTAIQLLAARGADINQQDRRGETALIHALGRGATDTVAMLLNQGAAADARDRKGVPALILAAEAGQGVIVGYLLQAGANPNLTVEKDGRSAVMAAAAQTDLTALGLLIAAAADLNLQNSAGATALLQALQGQRQDAFIQLLRAGADPKLADSTGLTPLVLAQGRNDARNLAELLGAGADVNSLAPTPTHATQTVLAAAIRANQADAVTVLLQHRPNIGEDELHAAVESKQLAMLARLVMAGADVRKDYVRGPLPAALNLQQWDMATMLIDAGAPVNHSVEHYNPALMYAAQAGNTKMVALLLAAGAEVDQKTKSGFTSLYQTAYHGKVETFDQLLAAGADPNSINGAGFTPIMTAADKGHEMIVVKLIAAGANVKATTPDGYGALYYAGKNNKPNIITLLMAGGADAEQRTGQYNWTVLHRASNDGYYEVVENLLKLGANPNALDVDGDTPMDLAMRKGYKTTPQTLANYGGSIRNYQPKSGGGDTFIKAFATAAIATAAYQSDLPSHMQADVVMASVRDIWTENGQGTNLAGLQQQWASGNMEIRDPLVRQVFSASLEAEQERKRQRQELRAAQLEQQRQQQIRQQELQAQQQAAAAEQQRRNQLMAQQQAQERQLAEQRAREQAQQRQREQQLALQRQQQQAAQPRPVIQVGAVPASQPSATSAAKPAEPAKVALQANSGSVRNGPMQDSEKLDCDCAGTITKQNITVGSCEMASLKVGYDIGAFFGEPLVKGDYSWLAKPGSPESCLPYNFTLWLKIVNQDASGYIKIDPVVPKSGGVSFSGTASSPNWNQFICGYEGAGRQNCFDSPQAKQLLKKGRIVDVEFSHR